MSNLNQTTAPRRVRSALMAGTAALAIVGAATGAGLLSTENASAENVSAKVEPVQAYDFADLVEAVEPAGELAGQVGLGQGRQRIDHFRQRRRLGVSAVGGGPRRPHDCGRLRQVADIVVGEREQHRVGALDQQRADQARLGVAELGRAGERGKAVAALRVGHGAQIGLDQPKLAEAARLVGEAVEEMGEGLHDAMLTHGTGLRITRLPSTRTRPRPG